MERCHVEVVRDASSYSRSLKHLTLTLNGQADGKDIPSPLPSPPHISPFTIELNWIFYRFKMSNLDTRSHSLPRANILPWFRTSGKKFPRPLHKALSRGMRRDHGIHSLSTDRMIAPRNTAPKTFALPEKYDILIGETTFVGFVHHRCLFVSR